MKTLKKEEWTYSDNEENFHGSCDSKEEAIVNLKDDHCDDEWGYIGKIEYINRRSLIFKSLNLDYLIENMSDHLYDEVGEVAENFNWENKEEIILESQLKSDITNLIYNYMKINGIELKCHKVVDIEQIEIHGDSNHE